MTQTDKQVIERARRRLLRDWKRLSSWRAVGAYYGINHGHCVVLVKYGRVPKSFELRLALGLPRVMPSERRPRGKVDLPVIGVSDEWQSVFFKRMRKERRLK